METMTVTMASIKHMCERGFDVTAWFVAAWKVSDEDELIQKSLYCDRIKK